MDQPLIQVENLTHRFDNGSGEGSSDSSDSGGIFDISFSVRPGEFILLAGPNGSGKSTLIRHLNALILPTAGTVRFAGKDVRKHPVTARRGVGMVFQDADTQIVGDTVADEVAFGPENLKMERTVIQQKVEKALEQMALTHLADRNPATLSGGEKRRLAIAGILVMEPRVIVFDEPFANLDYPSSMSLIRTVRQLNQDGQTIIMASHEVEDVVGLADRLLIMEKGWLVRDDRPGPLFKELPSFGIREPWFSRMGLEAPPW